MSNNCIPFKTPDEWKQLLADPEKHWKPGYSAWATAHSWLAVDGFPPEIEALFSTSALPVFQNVEMLLAIPEHKVLLPPRSGHPSQNDLFVLAKAADGNLMSIMVEGKVSETFGEKLSEWTMPMTAGKSKRFLFLMDKLGLTEPIPLTIRYQLFHRLVSAIIEAEHFRAKYAVMVIQSFSPSNEWFEDYSNFLCLFGAEADIGRLVHLADRSGIAVYSGWVKSKLR
jgi:hypothetical protein